MPICYIEHSDKYLITFLLYTHQWLIQNEHYELHDHIGQLFLLVPFFEDNFLSSFF
jgi:hypothetical protein